LTRKVLILKFLRENELMNEFEVELMNEFENELMGTSPPVFSHTAVTGDSATPNYL